MFNQFIHNQDIIQICEPYMKQDSHTSQQIELISQYAELSDDPNLIATKLHEVIKNELGLHRSVEQLKDQLAAIQKRNEDQRLKQAQLTRKQQSINLFKTFEEENKNNDQAMLNFVRPVARRKNSISYHCKRKIPRKELNQIKSEFTLQDRLNQIEQINEQCTYNIDKLERKLNRKTSVREQSGINCNVLWFYNEFFYSNYDLKYFESSAMKQVYSQLNLKSEIRLRDHKNILRALPKPKLFNDKHLLNEKTKLEQYRNSCRQNTKNLSKNNETGTQFPVHSIVLALHPMCGHLHTGSIMAYYKENLYMVRFLKPELPAHKILDINMSTQFTNTPTKVNRGEEREKDKSYPAGNDNAQGNVVDNINFEVTAYLIKILEFKAEIVKLMRYLNDKDDKKQNLAPQKIEETRLAVELFQWAVKSTSMVDYIIQQMLVRFRLRGVNQANSNSIFGNLKNLLVNPLKLMSKQFENSNDQSDINATQQIKQIINKQRDSQIKKAISNAIMSVNTDGNDNKIQQSKMMPLIYSCLGILADLKHQGKDFDVQSNPNLMKLADLAGKENSEVFNEVYERLFSIVAKFKQ